jgi:Ca2+-binding EF-hand superfamily protein
LELADFSNIMDKNSENWEETKNFYRKVFSSIDEDLNGYLSDKEFKKFLMTCDIQVIATLTISNFYAFSKKVFLQTYLKLRRKYSRKII